MKLADKELLGYVSVKLALPGEERDQHRQQVARLLDKLDAVLAEEGSYKIKKFRRAGSLEKGTSNRPRVGKPVDADVGVYFDADPGHFDIVDLQRLIKRLLEKAYPQKAADDFEEGGRTFGVVFKGSGLEVDLVPIVATDVACDYGLQYSRAGDCVRTSIKAHIAHYRDHAGRDPLLAALLRLVKRWRYWQDLKGIQSFHLELILSYLVDSSGPAPGIEEGLRRFFLFVARDLDRGVAFDGAAPSAFADPVVVVDPANADNNVSARITGDERDAFVGAANEALVTLTVAQGLPGKGETLTAWKELFGENFSID
ncbi:MAG TPA: CBASS oligonucleotide cyclase [Gaiellales bacterium]|nr:CBASS oligonucleotide cyclase [Gaiellales bacterium]